MAQSGAVGKSAFHKKSNDNNDTARKTHEIVPISKIFYIKKTMNIWVANVCSISGNSDNSKKRKDHLIDLITNYWPKIIILLETNHQSEPNILSNYYDNFCTPSCNDKGIIILTKKLLACEFLANLDNRGLVVRSKIIKGFTIIGTYCPYYNLREPTIEFLRKYQQNAWFTGGDLENYGEYIISFLNRKFWADIEYSRELNDVKSRTEYIGYFYEKPKIKVLEKISDHFILNAEINTKWDGIKISFPRQLSRISAICSIKNENSESFSEMLMNWPNKDFRSYVQGLIPYQKREIKIYRAEISLNDVSENFKTSYRKEKYKRTVESLKNALDK